MNSFQQQRLQFLKNKFLQMLPDDELQRQFKKCPNKWVWSAVELEIGRRYGDKLSKSFNKLTNDHMKNIWKELLNRGDQLSVDGANEINRLSQDVERLQAELDLLKQRKCVAEVAEINNCPIVYWDKSLPVGTKLYL